jgi:tetratricopeptide (TPR) repeat protein
MKTYGQAYMMASEYTLAIEPLQKAAAQDADGDLWFQIGQVLTQLDRHAEAIPAFQSSIKELSKKVTIRDENGKTRTDKKVAAKIVTAHMQIGTSQTELKKFDDARKSFASARKLSVTDQQKKVVKQWSNYLKAEEAREKMLSGDN